MKRRDLLKSAMAIAASPLTVLEADAFAKSGVINLFENPEKDGKVIPRFGDGRDWFFEKRFGLFIHWGIYSVAGWHEQHMYRKRLSRAGYAPLMRELCTNYGTIQGFWWDANVIKHFDPSINTIRQKPVRQLGWKAGVTGKIKIITTTAI